MIRVILVVLALVAVAAGIYHGLRLLFRVGFPPPEASQVDGEKVETESSPPLLERRMSKILLALLLLLFFLLGIYHVRETGQAPATDLVRPTLEQARP